MENTHNFYLPKTNRIGVGAIKDLPIQLMSWKLSKALIVTDKNMIKLGYVENIGKILKSLFITYDIFDGVLHPNPTASFVEDGLSYFNHGLNVLKRDYKLIISNGGGTNHDCAKAIATVNDPIFMTTMPKEVTAGSGFDVISHGVEAFVSTEAFPATDALALEAVRLAFAYLPGAYENGNDLEAREKMMHASIMAAMGTITHDQEQG